MKLQVEHDSNATTPDVGITYLNCHKCLQELPPGISPKEWSRQRVAITPDGMQVWCIRHECNIDMITFKLVPNELEN